MKRFTSVLVTALFVSVTALAQPSRVSTFGKPFGPLPKVTNQQKKAPSLGEQQKQSSTGRQQSARMALMNVAGAPAAKSSAAKALKAPAKQVVVDQPKGDYVSYVRSSDAFYYYWGYIFQTSAKGSAGDVVFDADGNVYIKNLISQYTCNSWSKGRVDGNKLVFDFPQGALNYYGSEYKLFLGSYDPDYVFVALPQATLTLDYDPITGDISTPKGSDFASGDLMIGLCAEDGSWAGYSDWNINMVKQTEEPVAAPDGLATSLYSLQAEGYAGSTLYVGFLNDEVYLQGLYTSMPEAWVKGTVSGNKAVFKSGQYLGSDGAYHQYLMAAEAEEAWDDYYEEYYTEYTLADGDIVFDYDPDTKTLSNSTAFLVNAGKDEVYYALAINKGVIAPFEEKAATPAAPAITGSYYEGYSSHIEYGFWEFSFDIPTSDVDGNYILPEKLSYQLYTRVGDDVQPLTLHAGTYVELDEDMTEIPYGFTEGWDIYAGAIYLYITGFDAVGIQSIYRGAGEEHKSEIGWYETGTSQPGKETPEYPELDPANVGGTVAFTYWDGNTNLVQVGEYNSQTYDVAMKLQADDIAGTHIDRISFVLMETEGVSNVKAWLSTNLRVENGKNAPNLIEVPVENIEPGIITVELDKPYTLSDEGVYVGYSFTIDNADIEANQTPIVAIGKKTDGGFFIHSSKTYVGWYDLGEEAGFSSYITVDLSGAAVKADAASLKAGGTQFVKTGETIETKTVVVNHGSNGISSLDIDYTLNGTVVTKHFDLSEPVPAIFGQTTTLTAELPAIGERGTYSLSVKVAKVNGVVNEDNLAQGDVSIVVLNTVPKHRTLLEEYTGTWCGWCVRGFVGLAKLAELYPDDYVLVSYHNADPMEFTENFPSAVQGFPTSWMDRVQEVDPYYGYNEAYGIAPLTIKNALDDRAKEFGIADILVNAGLNEEENTVEVAAEVTFPYDLDEEKYEVEFILVADGLTGEEGSDWDQSNYYSGQSGLDENLAPFGDQPSYVPGLVFNDVAVSSSRYDWWFDAAGIEAGAKADETIVKNYTFYLEDVVNTSGEPIIQDSSKLRAVAIIIDKTTGEVVNAAKAEVVDITTTGITSADAGSRQTETVFYDLTGRRISAPANGVYVKTLRLNNGQTKSQKVFIK